eukprot:m51a1_g2348 hypothetical protein (608) ;mRNA; f:578979-582283
MTELLSPTTSVEYMEAEPHDGPAVVLSFAEITYNDNTRLMCLSIPAPWRESRSLSAKEVCAAGTAAALYHYKTLEKVACESCPDILGIDYLAEVLPEAMHRPKPAEAPERYQHTDERNLVLMTQLAGTVLMSPQLSVSSRKRRHRKNAKAIAADQPVTTAPANSLPPAPHPQSFLEFLRGSSEVPVPPLESLLYSRRASPAAAAPQRRVTVEVRVWLSLMSYAETCHHVNELCALLATFKGRIQGNCCILPGNVVVAITVYDCPEAAVQGAAMRDGYCVLRGLRYQVLERAARDAGSVVTLGWTYEGTGTLCTDIAALARDYWTAGTLQVTCRSRADWWQKDFVQGASNRSGPDVLVWDQQWTPYITVPSDIMAATYYGMTPEAQRRNQRNTSSHSSKRQWSGKNSQVYGFPLVGDMLVLVYRKDLTANASKYSLSSWSGIAAASRELSRLYGIGFTTSWCKHAACYDDLAADETMQSAYRRLCDGSAAIGVTWASLWNNDSDTTRCQYIRKLGFASVPGQTARTQTSMLAGYGIGVNTASKNSLALDFVNWLSGQTVGLGDSPQLLWAQKGAFSPSKTAMAKVATLSASRMVFFNNFGKASDLLWR